MSTESESDRARHRFRGELVPEELRFTVDPKWTGAKFANELRRWFTEHPDHAVVAVVLEDGSHVGVSTREIANRPRGVAGRTGAGVGDGDGATAVTGSTRYEPIKLVCKATHAYHTTVYVGYYDEHSRPLCPNDPAHGEMELP